MSVWLASPSWCFFSTCYNGVHCCKMLCLGFRSIERRCWRLVLRKGRPISEAVPLLPVWLLLSYASTLAVMPGGGGGVAL
jgi:hypothetical protein